MLAGVQQHLLVTLAQQEGDRGRLDELGPVADYREDSHMGLVSKIVGLAAGAVRHAAWYVSYHMRGEARSEDEG